MNFLRVYGKRFCSNNNVNKFSNVNKEIKYNQSKIDLTHSVDKLQQVIKKFFDF